MCRSASASTIRGTDGSSGGRVSDLQTVLGLGAVAVVVDLAIRLVALVVVPRNRLPTAAMAWLLAIFFIPVIGVLLFLLIGSPKLPKDRRAKQDQMNGIIADTYEHDPSRAASGTPQWLDPMVTLNENMTGMPLIGGNTAELLDDYAGSLAAMAAEVDTAVSYVHVEFYILSSDQATAGFFASLEAAIARGVTVRVLLDHWASSHCRDYKATIERLTRMGAQWHLMLPVQPLHGRYQRLDLRNHRKLLVVDGQVGFVGSQNVIDRSYNKKKNIKRGLKWQELMCRVEGPVVTSIDLIFSTDWYMESGERLDVTAPAFADEIPGDVAAQIVPSGPGFPVENNLQLFLSLLYSARQQIIIT